ncbi:MAG: hypothetical protein HYS87_02455 [Candidatus Colwellbacteria bacterium]|nr:hypothetical protein [Candidatus Colwellbacteria bacterium]
MSKFYKIVVFVPVDAADKVRGAITRAGGGRIGNYSGCSFSSKGIGRFKPEIGADPVIGKVGQSEKVEEERIEVRCEEAVVKDIITAIKKSHPYNEVALDVYELVDF